MQDISTHYLIKGIPSPRIVGSMLDVGDVITKDDVYDSTSGQWEKVPHVMVGMKIQEGSMTRIVRPAKQ